MTHFDAPNFTQTPNALFDALMCELSEVELKVLLVAIRKIFGWHKRGAEPISLTQFEQMSGLSRRGVINGIQSLEQRGLLLPAGTGKRNTTLYTLNVQDVHSDESTGESLSPQPVNVVHQLHPTTGESGSPTKERRNKGKKARAATQPASDARSAAQALAQAWLDGIGGFGTAPAYLRPEALQLLKLGATAEDVGRMAAEKQSGRAEPYRFSWLLEDYPLWRAEQLRKQADQAAAAAERVKVEQELQWARQMRAGVA